MRSLEPCSKGACERFRVYIYIDRGGSENGYRDSTRFLSGPLGLRVPLFLLFGFSQGDAKRKRPKRVLLRDLV